MSMNAYMAIRLVSLNSGEAERKEHMYVWGQKLEFVGVRKFSFGLQIRSPQYTPSVRIETSHGELVSLSFSIS